MDRPSQRVVIWAQPPSFGRLLKEAWGFGALLGGIIGSATLLQGHFWGLPLGVGFGIVYGSVFALGGWTIGWMLVSLRLVERKGLALAVGVAITAVLFLAILTATGGTLDPFLIVAPCVVAIAVAIWRGHHYDRAVPK